MAEFERSIGIILKHEGGLVDHPNDPGGITNFGVSMKFVLAELQKDGDADGFIDGDFDHDGDIDPDDIRKMTVQQAMGVYRRCWWDKFHYELFKDQDIATKVTDMSINMGNVRAHKLVQAAANKIWSPSLLVDGVIGSRSFNVLNELHPGKLIAEICREQAGFYNRLSDQKPQMKVFLKGWLKRAAWPFKEIP
jgi:lysozyme family protein